MKAEKAQLPKKLDRPTPFTMKAFKINKAKVCNRRRHKNGQRALSY